MSRSLRTDRSESENAAGCKSLDGSDTHHMSQAGGGQQGGATHAFRQHRNIGRLQFAGRWRTPATLHHYLQEAMTAHLVTVLPDRTRTLLEQLAPRIRQIRFPPSVPVNQLVGWRGAGHGRKRPS